MTAIEAELRQQLSAYPDREGPEVAALLNDLALLRLEKVLSCWLKMCQHMPEIFWQLGSVKVLVTQGAY